MHAVIFYIAKRVSSNWRLELYINHKFVSALHASLSQELERHSCDRFCLPFAFLALGRCDDKLVYLPLSVHS